MTLLKVKKERGKICFFSYSENRLSNAPFYTVRLNQDEYDKLIQLLKDTNPFKN